MVKHRALPLKKSGREFINQHLQTMNPMTNSTMNESTNETASVAAVARYFPFSAIVGQPQLKMALLLCAVDPSLGGVLIRGDKGSAKSTAARALTDVLPFIERLPGCAYNCAPGLPCAICAVCNAGLAVPTFEPVPFVTLPLGATEDRVIGTLDLEQALKGAQRAFQPGLLAAAHRGILYIDEVNLLADHLVDVLLDVAAMGVNTVQRDGLSLSHPARFTLIGTMNQEEGDLRPQLLDRFGLMVDVNAPRDKSTRAEVVRRRIAFEADPAAFAAAWHAQQIHLREQLASAQRLLPQVALQDALLELISHLCCEFEVASLRADIVMHKAARALAALDGRKTVTPDDVRQAAELVLPHRRRRTPFEQPGLDHEKLDQLMQESEAEAGGGAGDTPSLRDGTARGTPDAQDSSQATDETDGQPGEEAEDAAEQAGETGDAGGQQVFSAAAANAPAARIVLDDLQGAGIAGRRSHAVGARHGQAVRAVPDRRPDSLAVSATLRSAALRQAAPGAVLSVTRDDLHRQERQGKRASLIVFVVDASGSMAAQRRMETVKGAVLTLLTDAYQKRDAVAVISFGGSGASLLLPPTRSVDIAEQGLRELPTGGRTPLPHALSLALDLLTQADARTGTGNGNGQTEAGYAPLLILLSDGRANVPLVDGGDPWQESLVLAQRLAATGAAALVLDTESGYLKLGQAAQLAQALGAPCLNLEQLGEEGLVLNVRRHTDFIGGNA